MNFSFTVLGSSAAAPTKHRNPSSFLVNHNSKKFLVDCGEGTQMRFLKFGIKFQNIDHIFISHLHGDHFFGLVGLISTLHLMGRTNKLNIYAPRGLDEVITLQLKVSQSYLRFKIVFHPLNFKQKTLLFENNNLEIHSFPLKHGIDCCGFLFTEKPKPKKLNKEVLPKSLNLEQISSLLDGKDIFDQNNNILYKNEELTIAPEKSKKLAYCSDTKVFEKEADYIKGADLVYHEATFLHELKDRANATNHSTALKVGELAKKAEINQLLIGHFSGRYKNLATFSSEIKENFENVLLAEEGKTYKI